LSTAFAGTLPSLVLAVTAEPGGVSSTNVTIGVGVAVGVAVDVAVAVAVGVAVAVAVAAGVAVGVGVTVGVGVLVAPTGEKTLISVTLFHVPLGALLPCPTYRTQRAETSGSGGAVAASARPPIRKSPHLLKDRAAVRE